MVGANDLSGFVACGLFGFSLSLRRRVKRFVRLGVTDEDAVTQFPGAFASVSALVKCAGIIIHDAKEFTPSAVGK